MAIQYIFGLTLGFSLAMDYMTCKKYGQWFADLATPAYIATVVIGFFLARKIQMTIEN